MTAEASSFPHQAGAAGPPSGAPSGCPVQHGAVPLSGPEFQADPAELYRRMRRDHGPLVPVTLPGDIPAWLAIGYREVHQITSDPVLFSRDPGLWNQWPTLPEDWPLRPMVNGRQPSIYYTVGEEHTRHRVMVEHALEATDPFELRKHTEELSDRLIDAVCASGTAELMEDYARPLPMLVLARLLGIPDADGPPMARALTDVANGSPNALEAHQFFRGRLEQLLKEKREMPGADVTSRMLAWPQPFTDEEFVLDLMAIAAAGHITSSDWIGNSIRLMLTDDRFAASLGGGRHSVAEAMNEVLWEDTPTQILAGGRWATRDCRIGKYHVRAGDMIMLGLAAANADPSVHDATHASATGFRNGNSAHFSFSHGEFQCPFPAREIAEVMARTCIEVLLDRLPDIDLAVPAHSLVRRPSPFQRGMTTLPVQFSPISALGVPR